MFGLGFTELLVLAIIGLIVIGPKQLPDLMKTLARFVRELSKAREEWMNTVRQDDQIRDIHESVNEVKQSLSQPIESIKSKLKDELDLGRMKKDLGQVVDEMSELAEREPAPELSEIKEDERKV
ncbi:MAG: Sec-independent protein translocase protein TatB [Bdellovibrionota bacterium]